MSGEVGRISLKGGCILLPSDRPKVASRKYESIIREIT